MTWKEIEDRYHLSFHLQNGDFKPLDEWLDDVYLQLTKVEAMNLISDIMDSPELFSHMFSHKK
jgi:hypothetical protein